MIPEMLQGLNPGQIAADAAYALLVAAVLIEGSWLAVVEGRRRIRGFATAAVMGAGAVVVGIGVTAVHGWLWSGIGQLAPVPVAAYWAAHPVQEFVAAFIAWDAAGYGYHWVGHRTGIGWASHQVHHGATRYDMSLAWRQSWAPLPALVVFPLVALCGFEFSTVAVCAAMSGLYQALLHTSIVVRAPRWIEATVMVPSTHRRHHAYGSGAVNLGPIFTIWDRLGRTWNPTAVEADERYGATGVEDSPNPFRVEFAGWADYLRNHTTIAHLRPAVRQRITRRADDAIAASAKARGY